MKYIYIWGWLAFNIAYKINKIINPKVKYYLSPDMSYDDYYKSLINGFDGKDLKFAKKVIFLSRVLSFLFILMITTGLLIII